MIKKTLFILTLALVALSAQADEGKSKPGTAALGAVSVSATVTSIDYDTRQVTLKRDDGHELSLKVGPVAHNFNQVKKGDRVTFDYMEALAVDVRKDDGDLDPQAQVTIERAPLGEKPAGIISGMVTLKALVQEIDYGNRQVTLKGSEGKTVTLKVGEQAKRFNDVKKGDQVVVQYTEALGISVTPKG